MCANIFSLAGMLGFLFFFFSFNILNSFPALTIRRFHIRIEMFGFSFKQNRDNPVIPGPPAYMGRKKSKPCSNGVL